MEENNGRKITVAEMHFLTSVTGLLLRYVEDHLVMSYLGPTWVIVCFS
jgi:hypothetical protein